MASRRGKPNMTPEQERTLLQQVQLGQYPTQAARKVGLAPSAVSMRKARDLVFRAAIEAAEAGLELGLVAKIHKAAADGDWKAALAILERRFPERWAKPEVRAQLAVVNIDIEELKKALQAGMTALARMWAPRDAPDVDAAAPADPAAPAGGSPGVTRS